MSKYTDLIKETTKHAIKSVAVVAAFGGLYAGVFMYAERAAQQKMDAERKVSTDSAMLADLRSQMEKSGQAEKRFGVILQSRNNQNFTMDQDLLYSWLKGATARYRLGTLKFTRAAEVQSTKPQLMNLNYTVTVRQPIKIEFQAVSDVHVFSFVDELVRAAPGLIRIDSMQIKRRSDVTNDVLANIRNGITPLLVDAKIEFSWIGIAPKETKSVPSTAAVTPPAGN
jgi:hypothetical protein